MDIFDFFDFVANHGSWFYAITFAWTFLEGESFVIFAGLAASLDLLDLDLLIMVAWAGSFCGDQLYFAIGRRYGARLIERFPRLKPGVDMAFDWLNRYQTGFILCFRFIYLVRNFASFALGMSGVPWPRFLVLNFIAAGVWATTFAGVGYLFGAALENVIGDATHAFYIAMLALFGFAIGGTVIAHRRRRRTLPPPPPPRAAADNRT
jgi:membrane protein DedA with SNARE-associated domain